MKKDNDYYLDSAIEITDKNTKNRRRKKKKEQSEGDNVTIEMDNNQKESTYFKSSDLN